MKPWTLLVAALLSSTPLAAEQFLRATVETDGALCFDLSAELHTEIELDKIARRALGDQTFENPTTEQLAQNFWEVGSKSNFHFEIELPEALVKRPWLLLSIEGARAFAPSQLRGVVSFFVDKEMRRTNKSRQISGQACAPGKPRIPSGLFDPKSPAFVVAAEGSTWKLQRLTPRDTNAGTSIVYAGKTYSLPKAHYAPPPAFAAAMFERPSPEPPLVLVLWRPEGLQPNGQHQGFCAHVFAVYELKKGVARLVAENGYDCDV